MAIIWGFKEIRYDSGNIQYIRDFKELFPQTKVIVQIRENMESQSKSGWFKNDSNAINFLMKTNIMIYLNIFIKDPVIVDGINHFTGIYLTI
mgnify:CR=1 FL=1